MTRYYHCTSKKAAAAIKKSGFRTAPSAHELADYYDTFIDYFPMAEVQATKALWSETNDLPFIQSAAKLWNKRFGHGTVIWLSEQPDDSYGDYCFEFILPKDSMIQNSTGSGDFWLAWVPLKLIPPKYFRLLSDAEIEENRREES